MEKHVILIGPHGERDYVEQILTGGCPCTCGNNPEYALSFKEEDAEVWRRYFKKHWLYPHTDVVVEP